MTQYVQYDASGYIVATVVTSVAAPLCANQLALDDNADVAGKMVDVNTKQLTAYVAPAMPIQAAGLDSGDGVLTPDVDMQAEYLKVIADESYFVANFQKIS